MALLITFCPHEGVSFNGTTFRVGNPPNAATAVLEFGDRTIVLSSDKPVALLPGVTVTLAGKVGPDTIPLAFEAPRDCLIRRIPLLRMAGEVG